MEIEFTLDMKAFSVNAMSYRDARFKTKEFQDWFRELLTRLEDIKDLTDMADTFKAHGGAFAIEISVLYPSHVYYNKFGQISAKTFDITNVEKPLVDAIFRERMQIDDRNLVDMVSTKGPGSHHQIIIRLKLDTNYYA
jgi:hypothetical protein